MTKQILALGASNSKNSINKTFAKHTGEFLLNQFPEYQLKVLDLNDFEMPIYSIDRENENGVPDKAKRFLASILESDGVILSLAEHNGAYTAAFKNIYDWASRIEKDVWQNKPMLLLSTSPGPRGATFVLDLAQRTYQFSNKNQILRFSLPSFNNNFSKTEGIKDAVLLEAFEKQVQLFNAAL